MTDTAKHIPGKHIPVAAQHIPAQHIAGQAQSSAILLPPSRERLAELAEIFRLLADPSRLALLLACLDRAWPASELAEHCGQSPQAASHHLRLLKAARLVKAERHGKQVLYQADDDHVRHMLADLIEHMDEPHGHPSHRHSSHRETAS